MKRLPIFTLTLSLLLTVALWQVSHKAQAAAPFATITVTNTNDSGAGSLRQAIADAAVGDTINFNLANCPCTITLTSGELIIDKSLTIQGPGADQLSVSGNNNSRVFNVFGDEVTLDGLSVIQGNGVGGFSQRGGGIIHQLNGTLTVSHCVLSNNRTSFNSPGSFGGGIHNEGGTVNLVATNITNNRSVWGSGVYQNGGTMNITDSTISDNSSLGGSGGGVYNTATLKISRSSISNNIGDDAGGGIYNAGVLRLTQTTVSLNKLVLNGTTGIGGGIYNTATALITNSTISSNNVPARNVLGGGIYTTGSLTLVNSTITANRGASAGGLRCVSGSTCIAANTIIAGNFFGSGQSPFDVNGSVHSLGNNLFGTGNGLQLTGDLTTNLLNLDARLGPLADNGGPTLTHALLPDSSAINAGSNALAVDENNQPLTTDQRGTGYARRIGNTVDIGAVEHNVAPTIAASNVSLAAGSSTNNVSLALVNDVDTPADALSITATQLSGSGVTLSGISIASDGNVTATATTACNATEAIFTLRVTDTGSLFAETTLTINVTPETTPPDTTLTSTPAQLSGANVSFGFTGTDNCTVASFECQLDNGAWTACTSPQSYSSLSNGTHTFSVRAKDATGNVDPTPATYTWQVFVNTCGTTVNPATLATPQIGLPYVQVLSASPLGSYTFSVLAGTLPPGVELKSVLGIYTLTGLPTTPGTYTFTLKAKKNNANCEGIRSYTVTIAPTVAPILNCVMKNANGTYTAKFGYDNTTGAAVTIPVGANNYFTPGAQNRGQVTVFQPGRVNNAFSVTFSANGSNLGIWILKGPDGVTRPVNITTATLGCS